MAVDERAVDHVREPELAPRRAGAVAGGADELELGRDAEAAQQVRRENGGALEDHDEHQRRVDSRVVVGDLSTHRVHPAGDPRRRDHGLARAFHSRRRGLGQDLRHVHKA